MTGSETTAPLPEPGVRGIFDVEVPLRDGCVTRADVYLPAGDRHPVLLQRTPYSKELDPGSSVILSISTAVRRGYAVVVQDTRGRFSSEGEYAPLATERQDGHDTIDWIVRQPWSDGRVGMYGSSYMAAAQWQAAFDAPDALQAIAPIQAIAEYGEGRTYRQGALEVGSLLAVSLFALLQGTVQRLAASGQPVAGLARESLQMLDSLPELAAAESVPALCHRLRRVAPWISEWAAHGPDDPYWESFAPQDRFQTADVPALHVTSWYDQFHVGTMRNFEGMRQEAPTPEARDKQYLLVGPWGHYLPRGSTLGTMRVGDLFVGSSALVDFDRLQLSWFDRWLRDVGDGWPFPKRVRIFVMGANRWRDEDDWPLARAQETAYYLSPGGELSLGTPPAGKLSFLHDPGNPVPTTGGAHVITDAVVRQGPIDQRALQDRPDVLVWDSPVLDEDLEATGWVTAHLRVETADAADLSITLTDVWPDGRRLNVCDGYVHVDRPLHGETVIINLGATSQLFRAGHRLSVHVSGSSVPRHPVVNLGAPPSRRTIILGGSEAGTRLILPIVDADA